MHGRGSLVCSPQQDVYIYSSAFVPRSTWSLKAYFLVTSSQLVLSYFPCNAIRYVSFYLVFHAVTTVNGSRQKLKISSHLIKTFVCCMPPADEKAKVNNNLHHVQPLETLLAETPERTKAAKHLKPAVTKRHISLCFCPKKYFKIAFKRRTARKRRRLKVLITLDTFFKMTKKSRKTFWLKNAGFSKEKKFLV